MLAHIGMGLPFGVSGGFVHPYTGLDHTLAMLAVGLWAVQVGGRAFYALPLSFLTVMALGSLAGFAQVGIPMVEVGVVGSLCVFGLLLAFRARLPLALSCALVGLFAFFHGHAHGTEIPGLGAAGRYMAGFILGTGVLHATGIAAGRWLQVRSLEAGLRYAGGAITLVGVALFLT
jgi:urease accessory protein